MENYTAQAQREKRRERLQHLLDTRFGGIQAKMVDAIDINQGELSAMLKGNKAFGEKKARKLEALLGLEPGYFDKTAGVSEPPGFYHLVSIRDVGYALWSELPTLLLSDNNKKMERRRMHIDMNLSEKAFAIEIDTRDFDTDDPDFGFPPGTIIYIDPDATPTKGRVVLAALGGNLTMAKYLPGIDAGQAFLQILEPGYPESIAVTSDTCKILGVAVWRSVVGRAM